MDTIRSILNFVNHGADDVLIHKVDKHCDSHDEVSSRVILIKLLTWIRGRAAVGRRYKLKARVVDPKNWTG